MAAEHRAPNYMGVFWALLILTLAEVAIFYVHLQRVVMIVSLVLMALAKAGLVAAYFMHLRFERRTLAIIVVSPLVLSAIIIIGLTPDARFGWPQKAPDNWRLPGHADPAAAHPGGESEPPAGTATPPAGS